MFLRDVVFLGRLVSGSVDTERGPAYLAGLSSTFQSVAARLLAAAPESASRSGKTSSRGGHGLPRLSRTRTSPGAGPD